MGLTTSVSSNIQEDISIQKIKQKILQDNKDLNLFFLNPGTYSISNLNFTFKLWLFYYDMGNNSVGSMEAYSSTLNTDYSLSSKIDGMNVNFMIKTNKDLSWGYLIPSDQKDKVNPPPSKDENTIIYDKFFYTSKGIIYAAKDEDNIISINYNRETGYKFSNDLEFNTDKQFIISKINIPAYFVYSPNERNFLQTIWNENLVYGQVENSITNNANDIRYGWFCQTGNYTRKDGQFMDCDDDDLGRFCVDENNRTEFLFDSDNNGYRCRQYHGSSPDCGNYQHEIQTNRESNEPRIGQSRIWCQYADWGLNTPSNHKSIFGDDVKNACAEGIGNEGALPRDSNNNILNQNKLSYRKCKLVYPHTAARDVSINIPTATWSPWSKETADADLDIYYQFCAEHDTKTNQPRFMTNNNCMAWSNNNQERLDKLKQLYCQNYPVTDFEECGVYCADPSAICHQAMIDSCKGINLESISCKKFAASDKVNLDQQISDYCASLGDDALNNDLCGCFLPQSFYDRYFNDIQKYVDTSKYQYTDSQGNLNNGLPKIPECYFAACANPLSIKPFNEKKEKTICPDITQCIQISNINVDGTINADNINITSNNVCNLTKKDVQPSPSPEPSKNPSQDTLVFYIIGGVILLSIIIISIVIFLKNQKKIVK